MTDALTHDLLLVLPPTLTALAGMLVALKGLFQGKKNHEQGAEIRVLADGNLARLEQRQEASQREIQGLKDLIVSLTGKQGPPGERGETGATGETGRRGPGA